MAAAMEEALGTAAQQRAGDDRARRSVRAAERRDHRQPDVRAARGRRRPARAVAEPRRPAAARPAGSATGAATSTRCCAGAPPLARLIDECLEHGPADPAADRRSSTRATARTTHLGVTVSPIGDAQRHAARRDLPVHRSHRHRRARRAAAAEGQPGAGRRADGRHRARVPQRPGDDSRLRAAARSRSAARRHAVPTCIGIRDETDTLGEVVTNFLNFAKPAELTLARVDDARDRRARRRRDPRRGGRARRGGGRFAASSCRSRATKCCCGRRSATCAATRWKRAPKRGITPHIVIESVPDRAQRTVRISRDRQRSRRPAGDGVAHLPCRSSRRARAAPASASPSSRRSS